MAPPPQRRIASMSRLTNDVAKEHNESVKRTQPNKLKVELQIFDENGRCCRLKLVSSDWRICVLPASKLGHMSRTEVNSAHRRSRFDKF